LKSARAVPASKARLKASKSSPVTKPSKFEIRRAEVGRDDFESVPGCGDGRDCHDGSAVGGGDGDFGLALEGAERAQAGDGGEAGVVGAPGVEDEIFIRAAVEFFVPVEAVHRAVGGASAHPPRIPT